MLKRLLVFVSLSLVASFASETLAPKEEITLDRLIEMVKSNNKEIKIAEFEQRIKELEHDVAVGYMYGSLDFSETYSRSNHAGYVFGMKMASRDTKFIDFGFDEFLAQMPALMNPATSSVASETVLNTAPKKLNYPDARDNFETKFSYSIPFFTGGKLEGYREITKNLAKLYGINREKVNAQKLAEAKKGFYDVLLLEIFIQDLEKIKKSVERLEESVREFEKEGFASKVDTLEVRAKLKEVEEAWIKASANKELARAFLSFLAGSEISSLQGSFEELAYRYNGHEKIVENNRDIAMASMAANIAKKGVDVEKSSFFPIFGGFAEGGWNDEKFGDFEDNSYYLVGVQAKINIFNGGIDSANYQKAKVGYLKAKEQEGLAKEGVKLKAKQLLAELRGVEGMIGANRARVELNKEIYENYKERYKERLVSINDLLIKESEFLESTLKLYDAQNQKNSILFELENLSGGES